MVGRLHDMLQEYFIGFHEQGKGKVAYSYIASIPQIDRRSFMTEGSLFPNHHRRYLCRKHVHLIGTLTNHFDCTASPPLPSSPAYLFSPSICVGQI
ncbi:hypothetical protein LguiA_036147 [Lonicera macranthoides]